MYKELINKYLNGYKIVKVEKDPFIKGQINLWTDEEKNNVFGDRSIVKFFIREESNNVKIYQELVDKEKYKLQQENKKYKEVIDKLKEYLIDTIPDEFEFADYSIKRVKDILKEVE